uniref:Uncharacterized protein n=1 Tax=Caenorhabditis japonica TaxID=281687 RepID=A0A8R1EEW3_CAEJA
MNDEYTARRFCKNCIWPRPFLRPLFTLIGGLSTNNFWCSPKSEAPESEVVRIRTAPESETARIRSARIGSVTNLNWY